MANCSSVLSLIIVAGLLSGGSAISCLQCFNSTGWKQCFPSCEGEYCFIHRDFEGSTQGCVTGLPDLDQGCWQESEGSSVCFCRSDNCNVAGLQPRSKQVRTFACEKRDESSNNTVSCEGPMCYYRKEHAGYEIYESASCNPPAVRPVFFDVAGTLGEALLPPFACYHIQDDIGSSVSDCVCKTEDFCNRHGSEASMESAGLMDTVECQMIPRSPDDFQKAPQNCAGEYCFLQRATVHSGTGFDVVSYRKGCFNVTGSRKFVSVGHRQFDQGTVTEEMWFCRQNFCNSDLLTADLSASQVNNFNLRQSTEAPFNRNQRPEFTQKPVPFTPTRRIITKTRTIFTENPTRGPPIWLQNPRFATPTMIPTRNYGNVDKTKVKSHAISFIHECTLMSKCVFVSACYLFIMLI